MDMEDLDKYYCKILKEKDKRIAELEKEIELKNHTIEFLESQRDNAYKDYKELKKTIKQTQLDWVDTDKNLELAKSSVKGLQEENAKLKIQIKQLNKDWKRDVRELEYALLDKEEKLNNAIVPKFENHQIVYGIANTEILKGQIDTYDYYSKRYFVYFGDENKDAFDCLGNEWCYESELFATEAEAKKHLEG